MPAVKRLHLLRLLKSICRGTVAHNFGLEVSVCLVDLYCLSSKCHAGRGSVAKPLREIKARYAQRNGENDRRDASHYVQPAAINEEMRG
jgi:hypothetical protein